MKKHYLCMIIYTRTRKRQNRNMKKFALLAAILLCSMSLASYAQMTDAQVVE